MVLDLAIQGVNIVKSNGIVKGSVGVQGEKIAMIVEHNQIEAQNVIDGTGKYLFPGIIDSHVHLNEPGYTWREDFYHGTKAAAIGGVTTIVDMPMNNTPPVTNKEIAKDKYSLIHSKSIIDYSFWGGLVDYNLNDLKGMREYGIKAFKSFLSPVGDDYTSLKTGRIREALKKVKAIGGIAGFHCEDYDLIEYEEKKAIGENRHTIQDYLSARPVIAEAIATETVLMLAKEQEADVHICHVSHYDVVKLINKAKQDGVKVTSETCPHYLVFSDQDVIRNGMSFKCSPPIREEDNKNKMWKAIKEGQIDCIVSDHSPARFDEKDPKLGAFKTWGGISGLQTGLQVVYHEGVNNRGLSPIFIARTMAENPATIFGLDKKKGKIEVGFDADFVLFDPEKEWEIRDENLAYLNKFSAFSGLKGKGQAVMTVCRGKVLVDKGKVLSDKGVGQLIKAN